MGEFCIITMAGTVRDCQTSPWGPHKLGDYVAGRKVQFGNHNDHMYDTFSGSFPNEIYEKLDFKENGNLSFGHAMHMLKGGWSTQRRTWAENDFIILEDGKLVMYSNQGHKIWNPNQEDILAEDWQLRE